MTKKISFSLIFIFASLFVLTVGQFTPFEISMGGIGFIIYATIFIGLPIVLYKQSKLFLLKPRSKIKKLIATLAVLLYFGLGTVYVPLFCFGKVMCANIIDETLFTKQDIFNSKIVVRDWSCGAYDSSKPIEEIVTVRNVFGLFNFVTKTDTTNIDKTKWTRVKENYNQ